MKIIDFLSLPRAFESAMAISWLKLKTLGAGRKYSAEDDIDVACY